MESNIDKISTVVDYIESHITDGNLDLNAIADEMAYSKYHLHRMFKSVVGCSMHNYIKRRRITEAAEMLKRTKNPILDIALDTGYDTQRSFTKAFKSLYKVSPGFYRKFKTFLPLQLKYETENRQTLRGDMVLKVETLECGEILLTGYDAEIKGNFFNIGKCWHQLHKNKARIKNRTDKDFLIGVNDYSNFEINDEKPSFHYIAGAQVNENSQVPEGMKTFRLETSRYVAFTLRGRCEESLQPVVDYIYKEWFPQSSCTFNEKNTYDFAKYGEITDEDGLSEIQYWVPII